MRIFEGAAAVAALVTALAAGFCGSQAASGESAPSSAVLPVTRVVLFSSGVGYFEHRGAVSGASTLTLPFAVDDIKDALKSLVVIDGSAPGDQSASPSISYPSMASLDRALKGFRIDLSGSPRVADILARLRGAEVAVDMPQTLTGRIVSVETRTMNEGTKTSPFLVLLTPSGLQSLDLEAAQALRFSDPAIGEDFNRALSLILGARDEKRRSLEVRLPGLGQREATIGYVIAAPVWKASYRLDLAPEKPQFQGWAIIDNPGDQDWKDISLSLVSGRPVSFIQDLYSPLYLDRPTLPLAIAGIAAARSFDTGFAADFASGLMEKSAEMPPAPSPPSLKSSAGPSAAPMAARLGSLGSGAALETARAGKAGDQFQFTLRTSVSLDRGSSAMLPLVAGEIAAERVSIYSAASDGSVPAHPMLGARLSNTTGMRLPAGPIVVFDGGIYAGDALLDFFPEKDSRLIAFGEDLAVAADQSSSSSEETTSVSISRGVMLFSRRVTVSKSYAFKNGSSDPKKIIVEHPITPGAELFEPGTSEEKTPGLYRFSLGLPAAGQARLVIKERIPRRDSVALSSLRPETFLSYSSSREIPQNVRDALTKAIELRKSLESAQSSLAEFQNRRASLISDQTRIRSNLDSVGRDSSQGQQYLKRLMDAEAAIDQANAKMLEAQKAVLVAQKAYEGYIDALSL